MKRTKEYHQEVMRKNASYESAGSPLTDDERIEYRKHARENTYVTYDELPDNTKQKIKGFLVNLKEEFPGKKIWLTSSYAMGTYIDENTPERFKELKSKKKRGREAKISDFDLVVEDNVGEKFFEIGGELIHVYRRDKNEPKILLT